MVSYIYNIIVTLCCAQFAIWLCGYCMFSDIDSRICIKVLGLYACMHIDMRVYMYIVQAKPSVAM